MLGMAAGNNRGFQNLQEKMLIVTIPPILADLPIFPAIFQLQDSH